MNNFLLSKSLSILQLHFEAPDEGWAGQEKTLYSFITPWRPLGFPSCRKERPGLGERVICGLAGNTGTACWRDGVRRRKGAGWLSGWLSPWS